MAIFEHIIWDWNGTLIDDTTTATRTLNTLLERRQMPLITVEDYRNYYGHPINQLYEKVGFDLSVKSLSNLSTEWHDIYFAELDSVPLHPDSVEILNRFRNRQIPQSILSALPHTILEYSLEINNLTDYFQHFVGLEDNLGRSKLTNGMIMLEQLDAPRETIVMIGDTAHDVEVANALGISCILISRGAEARHRLEKHNLPLFDNFLDMWDQYFRL